ncbi:MAG: hypothetical protein QHJ82_11245 [Verrucomicrobiota bacterium]|nr:hypothetical protein [Verrucomicrobiota bacterium]
MQNSDAIALGLIVGFAAAVFAVSIAIGVVICFLLMSCFKRIPAAHRKMEPALVWLLLIPGFMIVWNFFVFPKLSESYLSYFTAQGRSDVGDCGRGLGLAYAVCCVCSMIPYIGILGGLAALVLLILYLVRAFELKRQMPRV